MHAFIRAVTGALVTCSAACGSAPPVADGAGGTGGSASGGSGAGPPGTAGACHGGPALDLTIREIAVYQAVKIPIARGELAVEPGRRVADVIEGRDALLRVFVDVTGDWTPRTLSARVTLRDGDDVRTFEDQKPVSAASAENDAASTFQVTLPAEHVRSSTRYAVEIEECEPATGGPLVPRVPATGDHALGARHTGALEVHLVPIAVGARLPDTSESALEPYRNLLRALFPVTGVVFSVGTPITTAEPVDWSTLLDQVRAQRQSDAPRDAVYYYGMVRPADSLSDYCAYGCTTGLGYFAPAAEPSARAAVGVAFGDRDSVTTLAHELGHNHGRQHAPCSFGYINSVDPAYPYEGGYTGSWGYDPRNETFLDPGWATDIMGYCDYQWISDYTYAALTERVALVNSAANVVESPWPIQAYRVALLETRRVRWGVPFSEPAAPFGAPEGADVLDKSGAVVERTTVYRTAATDNGSFTVVVPPPQPGWSSVRIQGAAPLAFSAPSSVPAPR